MTRRVARTGEHPNAGNNLAFTVNEFERNTQERRFYSENSGLVTAIVKRKGIESPFQLLVRTDEPRILEQLQILNMIPVKVREEDDVMSISSGFTPIALRAWGVSKQPRFSHL
jgi:hypothetical protein